MPRTPLAPISSLFLLVAAACGDPAPLTAPDAAADGPPAAAPRLYALQSELDLAGNLPGKVGQAVDEVISATDGPDDPTRYIVDHIIAKMDDGTLKKLAQAAEPFVTAYVNQRLLASSPQLLSRLVAVGRGLGDAARAFGTMDTLQIAPDGTATHAIVGVRVVLDHQAIQLGFADHGMQPVVTPVTLHATAHRLTLDRHTLDLSLGRMLRLVLDGAIVPHVDPGAVDLVGLLQNSVDCIAVGDAMADALGFGEPAAFTQACRDSLTGVATTVYGELDSIDTAPLAFDLTGDARTLDDDGDGVMDQLDGAWSGSVGYAGTPAPLTGGTFSGVRVK